MILYAGSKGGGGWGRKRTLNLGTICRRLASVALSGIRCMCSMEAVRYDIVGFLKGRKLVELAHD